MQALYQWQLSGAHEKDICNEFLGGEQFGSADEDYFRELLLNIAGDLEALDARLGEFVDRSLSQIDPVEHAIMLIGLYEIVHRADVPYRVIINEGVELSKRYGAEDGHKYVNAVLDRASRALRSSERGSAGQSG